LVCEFEFFTRTSPSFPLEFFQLRSKVDFHLICYFGALAVESFLELTDFWVPTDFSTDFAV
jgi:hypothetical protein